MIDTPEPQRVRADGESLESARLSSLLGRMLDDLVRIGEAQTRLFEANIAAALSAALDRALGRAIAAVMYLFGGLCVLGAIIILLQQRLTWWQALLASAGVMFLAGFVIQVIAGKLAARRQSQVGG